MGQVFHSRHNRRGALGGQYSKYLILFHQAFGVGHRILGLIAIVVILGQDFAAVDSALGVNVSNVGLQTIVHQLGARINQGTREAVGTPDQDRVVGDTHFGLDIIYCKKERDENNKSID